MSKLRLKPKYILLSPPTFKQSRSTHGQTSDFKSIQGMSMLSPKADTLPSMNKEKQVEVKPNQTAKDFMNVSEELNNCMQNMTHEQKRNTALRELINQLKESNREAQHTQKRILKPKVDKEKRRIQKEEYLLDQILQKHNEEVARISLLREQVNSARTDRVVFSALFKAIEKEIKHYESLYSEIILKTELKIINKTQNIKQDHLKQPIESVDEIQPKDETLNNFSISREELIDVASRFFMTMPEKKQKIVHHKRASERLRDSSKIMEKQIQEYQRKNQEILIKSQCNSPQEAVEIYSSVKQDNNKILDHIVQTEKQMYKIEDQIERIKLERRISEFSQIRHMQKLSSLPSTRKLRSCKAIKTTCDEYLSPKQIIDQMVFMTGISCQNHFQALSKLQNLLIGNNSLRKDTSASQSTLQNVLSKMQKFDNCERFFTKNQFEDEYLREIFRQKKPMKIKR